MDGFYTFCLYITSFPKDGFWLAGVMIPRSQAAECPEHCWMASKKICPNCVWEWPPLHSSHEKLQMSQLCVVTYILFSSCWQNQVFLGEEAHTSSRFSTYPFRLKNKGLLLCTCVCLCEFMCTVCIQVPMEAWRGCWAYRNWSCTQSWASVWVPRIQLRFSARTACTFNHSVSLRSNPCSFTVFSRLPKLLSHLYYHKFITIPLLLPYFLCVSEFTWITILFISCLNLRNLKFPSECENCSLFSISIYPVSCILWDFLCTQA